MRWFSRKSRREEEIDRELRDHLDLEAEEQQEHGLSPDEARHAARRKFGNITYTKEEVRSTWGWTRWEFLLQDLRYALRSLGKNPGFAGTAILTLALGIGASTAVFTVIDSVLLRPLAYHESGRLVVAWEHVPWLSGGDSLGPNPRHVDIWQKRATAFDGLTLVQNSARGVTMDEDHPRLVGTVSCLPNLLEILEVRPLLGRGFQSGDGVAGRDNVAILTYSLWQSLFHVDPDAIGKTIRIEDTPVKVIGVLPASFQFPNANVLRPFSSSQPKSGVPEPAMLLPAVLNLSQMAWDGNYGNWIALGRLKPGVSLEEAETQLNSIQAQLMKETPVSGGPGSLRASVEPMQEAVVGDSRTGLLLLMGAVVILMLIACLNLANAQLGRALARQRDAAVRAALGAARGRLIWCALAENLILAGLGATVGLLFATAGLDLLRRYSPVNIPRLSEVHLNLTVFLFTVGLALIATVLSSVLPALRLLSTDAQECLQQNGTRAVGSRQGSRLRTSLIGLQVFGCTALLLVAGLFAKSLLYLFHQDKGFDPGHVAVAQAQLPSNLLREEQSRIAFIDSTLENLRAIPGVQAAGLVSAMPLEGESWIESVRRVDKPGQEGLLVNARWASPGYFEVTRQRLVAGRFFEERDRDLESVVLSEGSVKALWGTENPVGSQISLLGRTHTVIGVVADSQTTSLKTPPARIAYVHYHYRPPYTTFFLARSAGSARELLAGMRQAVWKSAPHATIARVKTLDAQLSDSLAIERFRTFVLTAFGVSALLLAMLGTYGVLSCSVAMRKQEIGVRIALGATRPRIYALTFAEVGGPVFIGLGAGLVSGALAGHVIENLLYGTEVVDPPVILAVIGLFLVSAAAAAFLPARRAAHVDPMVALRYE